MGKKLIIMQNSLLCFFFAMAVLFTACAPQQDDKIDIGLPPENVTFSIEPSGTPNTYVLKNTTQGTFLYAWEYGGNTSTGEMVEAYFATKGDYEIKLTVFTKGGSATGSQVLNVPQDAPFNCTLSPVLEFLTNCNQKTWKLNPAMGALFVGPADGSQVWWQNSAGDVDVRPCAFNDEWTFTKDGAMIYDTKGDMWAEDYMGFSFMCIDETQLAPALAPWASGTHGFTILPGAVPQLMVSGLGAYIGLPKAANGAEVTVPQTSVTYDITKMQKAASGDLLEIQVNFGGGIWRFTLIAI